MEEILKLIEETFDEEIFSSAFEGILGLESEVEGKKEFLKSLSAKLESYRIEKKILVD